MSIRDINCASNPPTSISEEDAGADDARAEALAWLRRVITPGQVVQILALGVSTPEYRLPHVEGGFFDPDHLEKAVEHALALSASATGVYATLNPLDVSLLARSSNRIRPIKTGEPAADKDVTHRSWMIIDCDPRRPAGIPATDAECNEAYRVAVSIRAHLRALAWPDPLFVSTGNGYHLHYR